MTDQESLERPESIRDDDRQRRDGRPTNETLDDDGADANSTPTVAPEEQGGAPSTEHGPGGDL